MFRLNSRYRNDLGKILKPYGYTLEPTKEGYSLKVNSIEIYIPIRDYDVFEAYYVYIISDSATMITNELDQIITLFEIGILENCL